MKKTYLLLIVVLIATLCTLGNALTVDEIIEKNVKARGGIEKFEAVKTKRATGKSIIQGMEFPFILQQKRPDYFRLESTIQGMTIVQAYDGETAWQTSPLSGEPQEMPSAQAKSFRNQADLDGPLVGYKEDGFTAELIGKEKVNGTDVYHLKFTKTNDSLSAVTGNFITHVYLDAKTFIETKITIEGHMGGNDFKVDTYLGDYKKVGGLLMHHSMETKLGGQTVSKMITKKIELNVDIDDSIFKMLKKKIEKKEAGKE